MKVIHNGNEVEVADGMTVFDFLKKFRYRRVMVRVNDEQINSGQYADIVLKEGDDVKVKRISAGG